MKNDRDEVLLDVGYKTEGVTPPAALDQARRRPQRGRQRRATTSSPSFSRRGQGRPPHPVQEARAVQRAWGHVEKIKENDGVVTGSVIEVVRVVSSSTSASAASSGVAHRAAPRPRPHAVPRPGDRGQDPRARQEPQQRRAVAPRPARADGSPSRAPRSSTNLHKGQVRRAQVSSIVNFGAFVDLGGVDGLVHVSDPLLEAHRARLRGRRGGPGGHRRDPRVDLDRERVSLSLKATQEDPWQVFARTHAIGRSRRARSPSSFPSVRSSAWPTASRPRAHLRAVGQARRARRAGRVGRRRGLRQDHRHRPRASPHLAVAQAGQRVGRPQRHRVRPGPVRHGDRVRRAWRVQVPRGLRPRVGCVARGLRHSARAWEQEYAAAQGRWEAHKAAVAKGLEAEAANPTDAGSFV